MNILGLLVAAVLSVAPVVPIDMEPEPLGYVELVVVPLDSPYGWAASCGSPERAFYTEFNDLEGSLTEFHEAVWSLGYDAVVYRNDTLGTHADAWCHEARWRQGRMITEYWVENE